MDIRNLASSLALLPADQGCVLLTRHSIREDASNGMPGFDIPLTTEGRDLAEGCGRVLGGVLAEVYASQSPRCIDTGACMLRGAGIDVEVQVEDLLREPGCYVQKIGKAGPFFKKKGPLSFVNGILQGEAPGAYPARQASLRLLAWLAKVQPPRGKISVCVTHDTILGAFVHDLLGSVTIDESDWPEMMEGTFLWFEHDACCWTWRQTQYRMSHADLGF